MSFIRKFESLIKKSNENIINIKLDDGVEIYNYSSDFKLISQKRLLAGNYSFADICFDINEDDTLYGVVNENSNLSYLYINNKIILKNRFFNYNLSGFTLKFPYIKKINNSIHIMYYLINDTEAYCKLIHYCRLNDKWIKTEIDTTKYSILSNFVVTFEDSVPVIFYYKLVNNYEELFISTFDLNTNTWSLPFQITNTRKTKVYLSIIQDSKNYYHITFSENNFHRYHCTYIKGYISENEFIILNYQTVSKTVACTFPNLIECENILYLQWIEYSNLYACISYDAGGTWMKPFIDDFAPDNPFICYNYKSNYLNDKINNSSAIFACNNSSKILGLKK